MSRLLRLCTSFPQTFPVILVSVVFCVPRCHKPLFFLSLDDAGHYRNGSQALPEDQTLTVISGTGICLKTGASSGLQLKHAVLNAKEPQVQLPPHLVGEICCCVMSEAGSYYNLLPKGAFRY